MIPFLVAATGIRAQAPTYTFFGDASSDVFGWSASGAGDVNGDGCADIIVGAPWDDDNGSLCGSARVLSGADGSILYTFYGDSRDDQLGLSVSGAGDVDGDGHADVIVGAPFDDSNGSNSGTAYVFSGSDGSTLYTFVGTSGGDLFGRAVSDAGDVNDDGYADVIVGEPGAPGGNVRVLSGRDGSVLHNFQGPVGLTGYGQTVSGAGDVNNDGYDDLIVGAPLFDPPLFGNDIGLVHIYNGRTGALIRNESGPLGSQYGWSVSGAGDVDADGNDDVVIGARFGGNQGGGFAEIRSGADWSVLHTFHGSASGDQFGYSVSGAGDVNADGNADVIVGARHDGTTASTAGSARVLSGADGSILQTFYGEAGGDEFGHAVSGAGDLNFDGYDEVLVGAPRNDGNGSNSGTALVYSLGPPLRVEEWLTIPAPLGVPFEGFGSSLRDAGDVNADGTPDLIVGASGVIPLGGYSHPGYALVLSGVDAGVLHNIPAPSTASPAFGWAVSGAGDTNRDGFADLIVGAPGSPSICSQGEAYVFSGGDGSLLDTINGSPLQGRRGGSVSDLGDVNGDGHDDVLVGAPEAGGAFPPCLGGGSWSITSGMTGGTLRSGTSTTPLEALGASVRGVGDVNGDGNPDFAVGAPGADANGAASGLVKVYTGGASLLRTFLGEAGDQLGSVVDGMGDVNGDGFDDVVAASRTHVEVRSGADGSILYRFRGSLSSDPVGDVDGDGMKDLLLIGSPSRVMSGRDGTLLLVLPSGITSAYLLEDLDGNGTGEIAAQLVPSNGEAIRLYHVVPNRVGKSRTFGPACPGSNGKLPRSGITGRPVLGQSFQVTLRSTQGLAPAIIVIGLAPRFLDLRVFGASGCVSLTTPLTNIFTLTDRGGRASFNQPVPNNASLVGLPPHFQWFVLDSRANRGGVITANALLAVVGDR